MMRHLILCALVVAAPLTPTIAAPTKRVQSEAAFQGLLAADRGFADAARTTDLVSALTAAFDEQVFLIAAGGPSYVKGRTAARERLLMKADNATSRVEWTPVGGGVSADGRQGYTYGGMMIRPEGKPAVPVRYLAYWIRRPDGWRIAAYTRRPAPSIDKLTAAPPVLGEGRRSGKAADEVKNAEKAFSDEAQKIGLRAAFTKWGRPDSINTASGGDDFTIGNALIGERVAGPEPTSTVEWSSDEALASASGDMGVSIGHIRFKGTPPEGAPKAFPFFTVWARPNPGDPWRYVAE